MPLKNWCSIHTRCSKSRLKHSIRFCGIFLSLKQNFIAYCSSKVSSHPDCIFEIHQLWQSDFSRVYSNSSCSCWFEPEIIKIGQSSHKMYSNNILNFQVSTTILNACTKIVWKHIEGTTYNIACWFSTIHYTMIASLTQTCVLKTEWIRIIDTIYYLSNRFHKIRLLKILFYKTPNCHLKIKSLLQVKLSLHFNLYKYPWE